ncbi:MAG TPA: chloride channel protein [Lachnospiraceae bacterium]|nr:chloride channel protein [Lachnospiraceae bacterium]
MGKSRGEEVKGEIAVIKDLKDFIKWVLIAVIVGGLVGLVGVAFRFSIDYATHLRQANFWMLFFLPIGGIFIVWLYKIMGAENDRGTNFVLVSIRSEEHISIKTAPLIFISTVLTHLVGGSAGKEGGALQLGSSISNKIGEILKLDQHDMHTMTMCGMSAAFAALFGTPVTSAVFALEVVSIGIMHYSALVPCIIAAATGSLIAEKFGIEPEKFVLRGIPELGATSIGKVILLAILCAFISVLFCFIMKKVSWGYNRWIKSRYVKGIVGGFIVLAFTLIVGNSDYNGGGMNIVANAIEGKVFIGAFLLKMIFTAFTLGSGFKGGEIVPSFFTGATFGNAAAGIVGLNSSFAAGIGLIAVFCGVTNCPISALILSVEMFGAEGVLFFAIVCGVSYMLSGYTGLYSEQKIVYSKTKTKFIDQKTC